MKKIQIIILAGTGVVSFAGAFAVTWFVKQSQPVLPEIVAEQVQEDTGFTGQATGAGPTQAGFSTGSDGLGKNMTEKQLQSLIYDIREKMKEYKSRDSELDEQEERLKVARESLQQDVDQLNELRVQMAATLASLKQQEDNLKQRMVEITAAETANMKRIAGRYDKMDVSQAGKIIINMLSNNQLNDAAKIVYYMSDRTSGKLLGEIGNTKPQLAGVLCDQLKRIKESN
jgi:flagellar motility protein MotE (MotC chaperone)